MNRFITVGLAIAVAPAILLGVGNFTDSFDIVEVSEFALFSVALPLGGVLVAVGLLSSATKGIRGDRPVNRFDLFLLHIANKMRDVAIFRFFGWSAWKWALAVAVVLIAVPWLGPIARGITVGPWYESGSAQAPLVELDNDQDLRLATLKAGDGGPIKAGDLVKLQVITNRTCTRYPGPVQFIGESDPVTAWIWTGREPTLDRPYYAGDYRRCSDPRSCYLADVWAEESRWGQLGSKAFRSALIGKSVGETFELKQGSNAKGYVAIPLYGFEVIFDNATLNDGRSHAWWPEFQIASVNRFDETKNVWAKVTILSACRGRYLRREAKMGKFTLTWSALEGKCPAPNDGIRLQIGPLYFNRNDPFQGGNYEWRQQYRRVHPRDKFPEEYNIKRPGPFGYDKLCKQKAG